MTTDKRSMIPCNLAQTTQSNSL